MRYIGSKRLLAKYLIPVMQEDINKASFYIEPFVGGANLIDKINHKNRWAYDINHYLIKMYQALQAGWSPTDSWSKEQYQELKQNPDNYPAELVSFISIACSYSGDFFGGYSISKDTKGKVRNRCKESKNTLLKQMQTLKDVKFVLSDYQNISIPENSLVYCDPPYKAVKYYNQTKFNTEAFWAWCLNKKNCVIYVSEYEAPEDPRIKLVWQKEHKVYANKNKVKTATEKLYKIGELK